MKVARPVVVSSLTLPPHSYVYNIVPAGRHLVAISSDDSLRICDPETLQLSAHGVIDHIHHGVTCFVSPSSEPDTVFTVGRDGFVRCWDIRSGKKTLELKDGKVLTLVCLFLVPSMLIDGLETSTPILSLAVTPGKTAIAAGTELAHSQATVQIW